MRRLAIIVALLCALTLAACGPSTKEANEVAQQFCARHDGVAEVKYFTGDWPSPPSFDAYCRDGSEID